MQHLDEGTIHAWIDQELDAAAAARVAAHLETCGECAARVAQARGFVAGASRITGMLDWGGGLGIRDTKSGAGDSGLGTREGAPKSAVAISLWRRLRLTPVRAAAASIALVALGSALTLRQARRDTRPADRTAVASVAHARPSVASAPVKETLATVPRSIPVAPGPTPRREIPPRSELRAIASSPNTSAAGDRAAATAAKVSAPVAAAAPGIAAVPAPVAAPRYQSTVAHEQAAGVGGVRTSNAMAFDGMSRVSPVEGCWTVVGDTLPAQWLPRRLAFDSGGAVRQANGEVLAGMRWRTIPGGRIEVDGLAPARPLLTVTRLPGAGRERLSGTIRDEQRDMPVTLQRCE